MAGKKYWKILLVVMVITCENIGFITRGLRPLVINPIFSLMMTRTTCNIFQYFLPAMYHYLNSMTFGLLTSINSNSMISNFATKNCVIQGPTVHITLPIGYTKKESETLLPCYYIPRNHTGWLKGGCIWSTEIGFNGKFCIPMAVF